MRARRGVATHGGPPPYLVWTEIALASATAGEGAPGRRQDVYQAHQDSRQEGHQERQDAHQDTTRTLALAQARAAEMATYTQQLLAPYVEKIEAQAERIGHLEEQVTTLQAQLAGATSANGQAGREGAAPQEKERRPWWRRLFTAQAVGA
jgi:hypothetical protein